MAYKPSRRPTPPKAPQEPGAHPPSNIPITIITRDRWYGPRPQLLYVEPMGGPHKKVCFVPTESTPCDTTEECVVAVQELCKRNMVFRNWPDIPFNFLIGGDGFIYEGRGWKMKYKDFGNPAMQETLQIAYIGNYKDQGVPENMVELGAMLLEYGKDRKYIAEDYAYMECPLNEYYQYPPDVETYWASPEFQEFWSSIIPPPPPRPDKT